MMRGGTCTHIWVYFGVHRQAWQAAGRRGRTAGVADRQRPCRQHVPSACARAWPTPSPACTYRAAGGAGLEQAEQLLLVLHRRKGRGGGGGRRGGRHRQAPLLLPPAARRGGGDGGSPVSTPLCDPLGTHGGRLAGHGRAGRHTAALDGRSGWGGEGGGALPRAAMLSGAVGDQCAPMAGQAELGGFPTQDGLHAAPHCAGGGTALCQRALPRDHGTLRPTPTSLHSPTPEWGPPEERPGPKVCLPPLDGHGAVSKPSARLQAPEKQAGGRRGRGDEPGRRQVGARGACRGVAALQRRVNGCRVASTAGGAPCRHLLGAAVARLPRSVPSLRDQPRL